MRPYIVGALRAAESRLLALPVSPLAPKVCHHHCLHLDVLLSLTAHHMPALSTAAIRVRSQTNTRQAQKSLGRVLMSVP
eukprot:417120-Amphidinium_carterae.2